MSAADRLLRESESVRLVAAKVATVDTTARTVTVTVRGWDGGIERHGPCPYIPHPEPHGADAADVLTHPQRDTACLVCEDNEGGLWVAMWRYPV